MMKMMRNKKRKGFTLIELIVVIAILGILAAIAIPRFTGTRQSANESAVKANLTSFQKAAEMVAATNNKAITAVTTGETETQLGMVPKGPGATTYSMVAGDATADVDAAVPYPTTNPVKKYSDIK